MSFAFDIVVTFSYISVFYFFTQQLSTNLRFLHLYRQPSLVIINDQTLTFDFVIIIFDTFIFSNVKSTVIITKPSIQFVDLVRLIINAFDIVDILFLTATAHAPLNLNQLPTIFLTNNSYPHLPR